MGESLHVMELDRADLEVLRSRHPEVETRAGGVLVSGDPALVSRFAAMLGRDETSLAGGRSSRAIESLLPARIPTAAAVLQYRRNAAAREALIREFGLLTSAEVAELAGSRARNRAALAHRWREEGRIFSVAHRGETLYPAFQLDAEGRPHAVIAEVLASFEEGGWPTALWFLAAHGQLDGGRPVDHLAGAPERVVAAARSETDAAF